MRERVEKLLGRLQISSKLRMHHGHAISQGEWNTTSLHRVGEGILVRVPLDPNQPFLEQLRQPHPDRADLQHKTYMTHEHTHTPNVTSNNTLPANTARRLCMSADVDPGAEPTTNSAFWRNVLYHDRGVTHKQTERLIRKYYYVQQSGARLGGMRFLLRSDSRHGTCTYIVFPTHVFGSTRTNKA